MNLNQLLTELAQNGIKVWANGDQLGINAPAGSLTSALRDALVQNKAQLLNLLQNKSSAADLLPQLTVSPPAERRQPFPLTDIQQAYWVGRQGNFELGNVGVHFYAEIEGDSLDVAGLTAAWQKVINRHEMLRAVVLPDGVQQILPQIPTYQIEVLDLSGHSPEAAAEQLPALRHRMSHQLYSAENWPLFEIKASRLPNQRYRLHISMDILMMDGSGVLSVLQEWVRYYKNPQLTLPAPELSFRDYVLASQKLPQTDLYERSKKYWFERLDSLPPSPQLPTTANFNPAEQRFERHICELPPQQWQQLKARAGKIGLTPSSILMSAFTEVLTAWSKSPQFTLNMTLFNRLPLHPQVNEIIGDFTTINLLEVDNSNPADTFSDRAIRLQKQLWQDLNHYYVSGVEVLRELVRRRQDRMGALMPVVFTSTLGVQAASAPANGETAPPKSYSLEDLGELVYTISQTPQVWLDHTMRQKSDGTLVLSWDVVAGLFPAGMVEDMFTAYQQLLNRLATEDESWQQHRQNLIPAEHLARRAEYNATDAPISDELLHTGFLARVKSHPAQAAVISTGRTLTYRELYEQANQIGHWLRENGAKPNTLVAVVMEKGWEQIVAVLGILMSGAAYLPIDPELPAERQHYLLDQGQVTLALTQARLAEKLTWPDNVQHLSVDTHTLTFSGTLPLLQKPTDLAYVIYTSGSTGLPKGVVIDHRGAVNTVLDINRRFEVTDQDRVLALSALNFDLSVYDIFGLLAVGGTIVMPNANQRRDPAHWAELMTQHGVTLWDTVPALMQMLVDFQAGQPLDAPIKLVMMSGDWIPLDLPERITALWPGCRVMSLGGATEASIWSIYYPIERVEPTWKSIPYGKPLTNQQFHVLNSRLEPCPLWVTGDLYIGGIGLALGYWRDETKTNASFITHPRTGERLYKTGDLGRFVPDADGRHVIEFLGREDFQVKIRGHRIELGEIEAALLKHPQVKEVVVSAVGEDRHNKQLVAYVVSDGEDREDGKDSAPAPVEKYASHSSVLQDPIERLDFKLKQPGLRPVTEESVALIPPDFDDSLKQAYLARQSYREFSNELIPFKEFGLLLGCLLQLQLPNTPLPKYRYPSGGGLYPIQTYLYVKAGRVEGLAEGFYYYHPAEHRLALLEAGEPLNGNTYGPPGDTNQLIFEQAAFSIFLVGQMQAITPIYGQDLALKLSLVEAGYMGQLLMTEAPQLELGLCPIGDIEPFADIRAALKLEESHVLLHSFLGGKIDPAQSGQWLQRPLPQKQTVSPEETLSTHLAEKIPAYMIPAGYVFLDALPLTANGKVNRKALPKPDLLKNASTEAAAAPRTPIEAQLVDIWRDLLNLPQVGIFESFFEAGGDSLSATRIVAQIRKRFQIELPIITMFDNPTIAGLAEQVELLQAAQTVKNSPAGSIGKRKQGRL